MVRTAQTGKIVTAGLSPPSLVINPGDSIAFEGDSISQVPNTVPGGSPWQTNLVTAITSHVGTITYLAANGSKIVDLIARVAAVIAAAPKIVIIEVGVNDLSGNTDVATFSANYASYLASLKAGIPGVKIGCVSILCYGEMYPDPLFNKVWDYNAQISGMAYNAGAYYLDVRTAQLAYSQAHNTPPPGVDHGYPGGLTYDGVHPLLVTGAPFMSATVQAQLTFNW